MSGERADELELPFFDEDMPYAAGGQPPTDRNQNVAPRPHIPVEEPPVRSMVGFAGGHSSSNGRTSTSAGMSSTFQIRYPDVTVAPPGRVISAPVMIPRPNRQEQFMNIDLPIIREREHHQCKCTRNSLSSPKHKIARRNPPEPKDDSDK